jgi:CubicO group peptidase (beta-lactamase class C family)
VTAFLLAGLALFSPGKLDSALRYQKAALEVEWGIRQGVYPGAVLVVGRHDTVLFAEGFGRLTWARGAALPSPEHTYWDLASLTKVVATASTAMVLVDRGRLSLDAPVSKYLPAFAGAGKDRVTVRMLLNHTSGLPAWLPLSRAAHTPAAAMELVLREPLRRTPGTVAEYSDLNGILLGEVVAAVGGEPLDRLAADEVFGPLGMGSTVFAPALPPTGSVAPSRRVGCCAARGRVDDDNAFVLGGVAGHAGLFSTGMDLAHFAQAWLREGRTAQGRWARAATIREFVHPSNASGTRALGWDTAGPRGTEVSVYGSQARATTYGHTGWTGTMVWVDPSRDLFCVFLTNRSLQPHTRRSIALLRGIRSALSDAVIAAGER